jgi:hypothetical protein
MAKLREEAEQYNKSSFAFALYVPPFLPPSLLLPL